MRLAKTQYNKIQRTYRGKSERKKEKELTLSLPISSCWAINIKFGH